MAEQDLTNIEDSKAKSEPKQPKKPVRTISGVTPLTVVLPPRKCDHGTCIYCPGGDYVPQSYTDKSPAVMRALDLKYDPYQQVLKRLEAIKKMGHPTDKIEIIILGGTFLQYEDDFKYDFVKKMFDALNGQDSKDLQKAKKINESAEHRCVALCIENRPDNCTPRDIEQMLDFGTTRVEIGVQMPDDYLYEKTNRGHDTQDVIDSTRDLKNAGFKLGYHVMPGLPYSTPEKDLEMFERLFKEEQFRPDQLKIYPCQVIDDSPLAKTADIIGFEPYSEEKTTEILTKMLRMTPEYCRIMRMMREFPKEKLISGLDKVHLRRDVEKNLRDSNVKVNEIRMREVGFNQTKDDNVTLRTLEYNASGGKEYFLQFVNKDGVLFGLLRLRIYHENGEKKAMVRELHVYGKATKIGKQSEEEQIAQHFGLGKSLMKEAEKLTKENNVNKLSVISGVGVRGYYKKMGYEQDGHYVSKFLW
ncbi:MAG: tRNA uridine(34) 5-carboxymethylaminomethyl modification radical SAM/GNAT enzyme Elp3 [Candidatus Pacearchaeota archaeon]